jgi:hypothetical protein
MQRLQFQPEAVLFSIYVPRIAAVCGGCICLSGDK